MLSISEKLANRLSAKLSKTQQYRTDLVLADFRVLDHDHRNAETLLEYDPQIGVPSKEAVADTLQHYYKATDGRPRLMVDLNTVKHYPQHRAVACVVSVPRLRRPFTDVKRCNLRSIVAGTSFLGENMTDTWTVAKEGTAIYIERSEAEDIDTILRERGRSKSFRTTASVSSLTLNKIAASASETNYSLGDRVRCSYRGNVQVGEILGLAQGGAQVRFDNGAQAMIAADFIHGLVTAADESKAGQLAGIKEYYRKAYGYSDEDLSKLVSWIP
jgi:hypothetical protein